MRKIFAKELLEMFGPPFIGVWVIIFPLALTYVASIATIFPDRIKVVVEAGVPYESPWLENIVDILSEFDEILLIRGDWSGENAAEALSRHGARMAVAWDGDYRLYLRPNGRADRERLLWLAYQVGISAELGRPWQADVVDTMFGGKETHGEFVSCLKDRCVPLLDQSDPEIDFGECVKLCDGSGPVDWSRVSELNIIDLAAPGLDTNGVLISSVIALTVAFLPFLLTCSSMSREFDQGTLEMLLVAPGVNWWSLVIGKILVALFLTSVVFAFVLVYCFSDFGIPPRVDFFSLFFVKLMVMNISALYGIVASSIARRQFNAYFISALYLLCLIFLTGVIFPIASAATSVQAISKVFPLTWSLTPLTNWLVHGLVVDLEGREVGWLVGLLFPAVFATICSVELVRRRI